MSTRRGKILKGATTVISLLVAVALWQLVVVVFNVSKILLPSPTDVAAALANPNIAWLNQFSQTFYEVLIGYVLAAALGISLAIGLTYSRRLSTILYPFVLLLQLIPKVSMAPLLFVWFGLGELPKLVMALLIAFFPILVDSVAGLNAVEPELMDLVHQLRASSWQQFAKLRFTYALPHIFSGLKTSSTLAVIGVLVAEFVAGNAGLGYLINYATYYFRLDVAFAAILLVTVIGATMFSIVSILERLIIPWYIAPRARALETE